MAEDKKDKLPPPAGSMGFIRSETAEKIRARLAEPVLIPDPTEFETIQRGSQRFFRHRRGSEFPRPPGGGGEVPFWPTITDGDTPTVTVSLGYVIERNARLGDEIVPLIYHPVPNRLDGEDLAEFGIADGQSVYVKVHLLENGTVGIETGDAVEIVVETDAESVNPIPADGAGDPGTPGQIYYKLATAIAEEEVLVLQYFHAGDHIHVMSGSVGISGHFVIRGCYVDQELLRMVFVDGTLRAYKQGGYGDLLTEDPATDVETFLQDCCYVGDDPEDSR